jgi:hypothetical protein
VPSGPIAPWYVENSWAMTPTTGAGWSQSSGFGGPDALAAAGASGVATGAGPDVGVCAATTPNCRGRDGGRDRLTTVPPQRHTAYQ